MDIRKASVDETSVINLNGANDEPLVDDQGKAMTITVYGPGSKQYARAQAAQSNRIFDRLKRKGKTEQSAEDKAKEQAEFLASCTKEFSSNIEYDGKQGRELFEAVYSDTTLGFIGDQVAKHIADWANFTKGLPKP